VREVLSSHVGYVGNGGLVSPLYPDPYEPPKFRLKT